jgi:hypothetical protein
MEEAAVSATQDEKANSGEDAFKILAELEDIVNTAEERLD